MKKMILSIIILVALFSSFGFAECVDSDGGRNLEVKGTCTDEWVIYEDHCISGAGGSAWHSIAESYCEDDQCQSTRVWCQESCYVDGVDTGVCVIGDKPDLEILGLVLDTMDMPMEGKSDKKISLKIINNGKELVPVDLDAKIDVYNSDVTESCIMNLYYNAFTGEESVIRSDCELDLPAGEYTIEVTIDYSDNYDESDETNNKHGYGIEIVSNEFECVDNDEAMVVTVKGIVNGYDPYFSRFIEDFEDHCRDSKTLIQYFCSDNEIVAEYTQTTCTKGCYDGTCIDGEVSDELEELDEDIGCPLLYTCDDGEQVEWCEITEPECDGDICAIAGSCVCIVSPGDQCAAADTTEEVDLVCPIGCECTINTITCPDEIDVIDECPTTCDCSGDEIICDVPEEIQQDCSTGCALGDKCVFFGTRAIIQDIESYCDLEGEWMGQKLVSQTCQNNYECTTNFCSEGKCYDIAGDLAQTKGLVEQIIDFLASLFGFGV